MPPPDEIGSGFTELDAREEQVKYMSDVLFSERLAFMRLRQVRGHLQDQVDLLQDRDIDRPQLFDVAPEDAIVSLYLQLGGVIFLTGNAQLSRFVHRSADLSRFVTMRQAVRDGRTGRTAYQQCAIGSIECSLVSFRDRWVDLCPAGDDGYHVVGMDEERRRVFAFRSAPGASSHKHQLCHATISVADRPIQWLPLSAAPDGSSSFDGASRFVRVRFDDKPASMQSVIRLTNVRGAIEDRLLTVEETEDGPIARWSDPFRADHQVFGPDWRGSLTGIDGDGIPKALLLQERGERGYALHRLPLQDCRVQQLYAYLVNAGNR